MNKKKKIEIKKYIAEKLFDVYHDRGFTKDERYTAFLNEKFEMHFAETRDDGETICFLPSFRVVDPDIVGVLDQLFPEKVGYNAVSFQVTSPEMSYMMKCDYSENSKFLFKSRFFLYEVAEIEDANLIIEEHLEYMNRIGFPYFEKMSDLISIDRFLSSFIFSDEWGVKNSRLKSFFNDRESYSSLIAAKLTDNPKYEEIRRRLQLYWVGSPIKNDLSKIDNFLR